MHNIEYSSYPLNVNRKEVKRQWDEVVSHEDWREGASGLPNPIRWIEDGISDSYTEAEERIKKLDNGWYDQIAVKYKRYKQCTTKKYQTLNDRLNLAYKSLQEKSNKIHYSAKNVSSEFIGCKHCGSKIATRYIDTNRCPVCRTELRPDSVLKSIKRAEEKVEEIRKQMAEEQKKAKYDICWLVKIEYHT